MATIPQAVFDKYSEITKAMLDPTGFGMICKLVYTEKIQPLNTSMPSFKEKKVMNLQGGVRNDSGFSRGDEEFKTVETYESISIRVYWTQKEFKKFGSIEAPDGSILTIGSFEDMNKITRATALVLNSNRTGHVDWRFVKHTEPILHGLDQNFFMCVWRRS